MNMWMDSPFPIEQLELLAYERIIKFYMRYVLLRCTKYTNSKEDVGHIALYTFVTTFTLMKELEHAGQLGQLFDCMIDTIGQDVVKEQPQTGETKRFANCERLLADERMCQLATAVNRLDGFCRQVLVLHHIEMMSTKEIAMIYSKSIPDIRSEISRGERKLVEYLVDLWGNAFVLLVEDVCLWLSDLGDALDLNIREQVASSVLSYLTESTEDDCGVKKYLDHWNLN